MNTARPTETGAMQLRTATIVGVFTLGLAVGALASPWLSGSGSGGASRYTAMLIEELEADLDPARVQAAVARAQMRMDAAGLY